jgi:hypothetical protein
MRPLSLKFGDLDLGRGSVKLGVMGSIRRTVNVIIALALAALGCGGFVYFYEHGIRRAISLPTGNSWAEA